jgi:hypothetical protein
MDDFEPTSAFGLSAGDRAHLAAASREPAHEAALRRRIQDQQISTNALLDRTARNFHARLAFPRPRAAGGVI